MTQEKKVLLKRSIATAGPIRKSLLKLKLKLVDWKQSRYEKKQAGAVKKMLKLERRGTWAGDRFEPAAE